MTKKDEIAEFKFAQYNIDGNISIIGTSITEKYSYFK